MLLRGFDLVLLLEFRIKFVNANINIFTAFQKDTKLKMFWDISDWYALSLQISIGNISCPSPEVKWPAEYENVSNDVEDSIILNGRFMFKNKTESSQTTK